MLGDLRRSLISWPYIVAMLLLSRSAIAWGQSGGDHSDPYRYDLYLARRHSPMQERIRHLRPFPVCVVYWQPASTTTLDQIREQFKSIHDAGFSCLKDLQLIGNLPRKDVYEAALDAGLIPYWYGEGGWEDVTPELLEKLGLPRSMPLEKALTEPALVAYQTGLYRESIRHPVVLPAAPARGDGLEGLPPGTTTATAGSSPPVDNGFRRAQGGFQLKSQWVPLFATWLERQYGTLAHLEEAWNFLSNRDQVNPASFREAAVLAGGDGTPDGKAPMSWEFRRYRDILRFEAEQRVYDLNNLQAWFHRYQPLIPLRAGGELAMFQNFAAIGTDQSLVADAMADGGSFYPSIHPAHHFEDFKGKVALPVYLESQLTVDLAKGVWTGAWESTGMPSVYSGSYGFAATPGFISQMMLSYLAAGMHGIGIWAWNMRDAGWESGEYSLVDRQGKLTPWGKQAGRIAKAAAKYRFELWDARNEPEVGILYSWENMATAARLAEGVYPVDRDKDFAQEPTRAAAGAAEAFQQANIPFEFVTEGDLKAGLAARYKAIYLPHESALSNETLLLLKRYVQDGGRLVADAPAPWWDDFGRVQSTEPGSVFEQIFGVSISMFQSGHNVVRTVGDQRIGGVYADIELTHAVAVKSFDTGRPAVTEFKYGKGSAAYIGFEASLLANDVQGEAAKVRWSRELIREVTMRHPMTWSVSGAVAYRRVAPHVHEFFLVNDGPATEAVIRGKTSYLCWMDAVTGETLGRGAEANVKLEADSARWVRAELP